MDGFDLLGAEDALATQYITLRVKHIDHAKLKAKLGSSGVLTSGALTFVDAAPKAALDAALPIGVAKAKDYGIELETMVSNAPPTKTSRAASEFWPGLLIGGVVGASGLLIAKMLGGIAGRIAR